MSIDLAKEFLREESQALLNVIELLDTNFNNLVDRILNNKGLVITTGIGKPSYIAMKLSATLSSLGIQSFFLNPSEAFHGDLGRIKSDDLLIIFSNSGETEEISKLIPNLKLIGCSIACITGNINSALGKASDFKINIGNIPELPPLGLAPTTSAVVMLGIADALAMSVLSKKDFKSEDFAFLHPGGSLGKSLLSIKEIMRTDDKLCIAEFNEKSTSVLQKITKTKGRPGAAIIVKESKLVGIFTDGDLRRLLENKIEFLDLPISNFMSKSPLTVSDTELVVNIIPIFKKYMVDQLIVVNSINIPVGLIDIQDLLQNGFMGLLKN